MDVSVENSGKKKRSWRLRWSLRVLLVFVALVAIGLGWVSYQMRVGYLHDDVAANLTEVGGRVAWKLTRTVRIMPHSSQTPGGGQTFFFGVATRKIKAGPDWMQSLGVEPAFQRIEYAYFHDKSPEKLARFLLEIERLNRIAGVHLSQAPLQEEQLEHLLAQVEMEGLGIGETTIGNRRIPSLQDTKLKFLSVSNTPFSDMLLDDLPDSLTYLDATSTKITDDGLPKLIRLKNLVSLKLALTPTSEAAIDALRQKMPWCTIEWEPLEQP
ncbi:hypothetical protein [Blastopirellula marina]|uniref:Leucine-rich repeat domain-containing protein n=1 Tax=Blastopirellula marina TaxID=124 RepID=A0A2S8F4J4_9BACT|nr:hypothetical protein [Blastopirellula marina]PQO27078.1 hypothetical protein C5Y98_27890 [Blastopirellula marina]PTL41225.1 hypothetical protein C5Y97_27905 [Blastopirellula marina]